MKLRGPSLLSESRMWVKADLLLSSPLLQAIVILVESAPTPLDGENAVKVALISETITIQKVRRTYLCVADAPVHPVTVRSVTADKPTG